MKGCFDTRCREALLEMKDTLRDIDLKVAHLIEQHSIERQLYFKEYGRKYRDDD